MGWFILILAGLFEVGFTTAMRLSDGFTRLWPSLLFLLFTVASFYTLDKAARDIPLGTAYAVWTGIGAAGTFIIGVAFFGEPFDWVRAALLAGLVACILGLKMLAPH